MRLIILLAALFSACNWLSVDSACACSSGTCSSDCISYNTNGQSCSTVTDCTTCQCTGSACSSYCGSSTNYYTKSLECGGANDCKQCKCQSGTCNGLCSSYKTAGNTCAGDADCTSCKCAKLSGSTSGTCTGACSSYGTSVVGSACKADNECTSCKCNGLNKCTESCESYGTNGASCNGNGQCTQQSFSLLSLCTCFGKQCKFKILFEANCLGQSSCFRSNECTGCACTAGKCSYSCTRSGSNCLSDSDCTSCTCLSGKCNDGCSSSITGKTCSLESDCSTCQCTTGTCSIACTSSGKACAKNADCNSCTCSRGVCTEWCTGSSQACITDSDCAIFNSSLIQTTTTAVTVVNTAIDLTTISSSQLVSLLSNSSQDLTGCLVNCSNNGQCVVDDTGMVQCECYDYYTGSSCAQDIRPCSSTVCLNDGSCQNNYDENGNFDGYECVCAYSYYGTNCEKKIDFCVNVTCSGQGKCVAVGDTGTKCECYSSYSGDDCSIESSSRKTAKKVATAATWIAFLFIALFYSFFVFMDLLHFWMAEKRGDSKKKHKLIYRGFRGDHIRLVLDENGQIAYF